MKPFDLQKALAGHKVVTRGGDEVTIVGAIEDGGPLPVLGRIEAPDSHSADSWRLDGGYFSNADEESVNDLFMASEPKSGWINVYPSNLASANIYKSKEQADAVAHTNRVACIKIEWEE